MALEMPCEEQTSYPNNLHTGTGTTKVHPQLYRHTAHKGNQIDYREPEGTQKDKNPTLDSRNVSAARNGSASQRKEHLRWGNKKTAWATFRCLADHRSRHSPKPANSRTALALNVTSTRFLAPGYKERKEHVTASNSNASVVKRVKPYSEDKNKIVRYD